MIKIQNLKKSFYSNVVLDGIDLEINKGEVVAVIGPSGTGKSTLLRCINLLEKADDGEVTFDDNIPFKLAKCNRKETLALRKKTAMVFQTFNLFQKKTTLENVMEGLIVVQKMPKNEAEEIAKELLERVKVSDRMQYYPKHLSGGQQQRVAIARALAMKPELLLLDEPTSALDPELVGEVLETIRGLAEEGHTMLLVSHEMSFVRDTADKVVFMEGGKIIEAGTPEKIFTAPDNERTKEFLLKNRVAIMPEYFI